ncbi:Bug family tripartite tricarboxylate transporter substrate binding protein [Cobetia marina]
MRKLSQVLCASALTMSASAVMAADYPYKPITLTVPWSRRWWQRCGRPPMAAGLQEELHLPVNVVNKTGGSGAVGQHVHEDGAPQRIHPGAWHRRDCHLSDIGTAQLSYEDFTPIALLNLDHASFTVNADSEWKTLDDALSALKANPSDYTVSGSAPGAAYHLSFAGFLDQQGINPNDAALVPSEGAAPGLQELAAGGVDIVSSPLPEIESMRKSGRVKALAVLANDRVDSFEDISSVKEVTGDDWIQGSWRGLARAEGPAGRGDRTPVRSHREGLEVRAVPGLHVRSRLRHRLGRCRRFPCLHERSG